MESKPLDLEAMEAQAASMLHVYPQWAPYHEGVLALIARVRELEAALRGLVEAGPTPIAGSSSWTTFTWTREKAAAWDLALAAARVLGVEKA